MLIGGILFHIKSKLVSRRQIEDRCDILYKGGMMEDYGRYLDVRVGNDTTGVNFQDELVDDFYGIGEEHNKNCDQISWIKPHETGYLDICIR